MGRATPVACSPCQHPPAVCPPVSHLPSLSLSSLKWSEQGPFQLWNSVTLWTAWACQDLESSKEFKQISKTFSTDTVWAHLLCYRVSSQGCFWVCQAIWFPLVTWTGRSVQTAFWDNHSWKAFHPLNNSRWVGAICACEWLCLQWNIP